MATRVLGAVLLVVVVQGCRMVGLAPRTVAPPVLTPPNLASFTHTYTQRRAGDSVGTMEFGLLITPDSVVNTITGFMDSASQRVVAIVDPRTLRARRIHDSWSTGRVELTYGPGRLSGTVDYWDAGRYVH